MRCGCAVSVAITMMVVAVVAILFEAGAHSHPYFIGVRAGLLGLDKQIIYWFNAGVRPVRVV